MSERTDHLGRKPHPLRLFPVAFSRCTRLLLISRRERHGPIRYTFTACWAWAASGPARSRTAVARPATIDFRAHPGPVDRPPKRKCVRVIIAALHLSWLSNAKDVRRRLSRYPSPGRRPHNPMVRRPSFYELLDRFKSFSDFISTAFCKTRSNITAAAAIMAEPKVMRMPIKTPPARSSLFPKIMNSFLINQTDNG